MSENNVNGKKTEDNPASYQLTSSIAATRKKRVTVIPQPNQVQNSTAINEEKNKTVQATKEQSKNIQATKKQSNDV